MKTIFEIPIIKATEKNLDGYGNLIDNFDNCQIQITQWPKEGWREIDQGTGDEGGITEGSFHVWWDKNILYGKNDAVPHKNINDYTEENLRYAFPKTIEVLAQAGHGWILAGDPARAQKMFTKALEFQPSIATYLIDRSIAAVDLKDFRSAARDLNAAVRIDPENTEAFAFRARFHPSGAYNLAMGRFGNSRH